MQCQIPPTPLDLADKGPVQSDTHRKGLLGQGKLRATRSYSLAERGRRTGEGSDPGVGHGVARINATLQERLETLRIEPKRLATIDPSLRTLTGTTSGKFGVHFDA